MSEDMKSFGWDEIERWREELPRLLEQAQQNPDRKLSVVLGAMLIALQNTIAIADALKAELSTCQDGNVDLLSENHDLKKQVYNLKGELNQAVYMQDKVRAERDRAEKYMVEAYDFHPRAVKLIEKRKNFVVVSESEPYFLEVYKMIRAHEYAKGSWTTEDEALYQIALERHGPK